MKLLLLGALAILASAHAVEEAEAEHNYVYIPNGDGVPQLVDLNEKYELTEEEIERNVNTVSFNLYTRSNPNNPQVLHINNIHSVWNSHWHAGRHTRVVTHGWQNNQWSPACVNVRSAYLAVGDYNVIVVDWGNIAGQLYGPASGQVRNVGNHVAAFLNFMRNHAGLNVGTTTTIGHSLGGHVAGIAARGTSGNLQAVVALDPALPGFDNAGAGSGVHRDDANQVQVIHTNGGQLGLLRAAGKTDFYPNGGFNQPGCGLDVAGTCAHGRAVDYFAESIRNPWAFRARENGNVFMGGRALTGHHGIYNLDTRASSPFGLG